jgi:hypothetical protein
MNTQSNGVPASPFGSQAVAPAMISETRPMYWSIRRELWENRSLYIAPLAVAAVYGFGFLISLFWVPRSMRGMEAHGPMPSVIVLAMPYSHAAMLIMLIAFLVGIFYSLDALHSERRDRTILFWKSLPVSDLTTVLSKASIPLVVLPLLAFAITVALQLIMLLLNAAVLLVSGAGTGVGDALRYGRAGALACAHLLLVSVGLRLGAARDISMGRVTAAGDCRWREDCVPHFIFRPPDARPLVWIRSGRFRPQGQSWRPDRCAFYSTDTTRSRQISEQPGSVARACFGRNIAGRSSPAAPLSRAPLIRMQS